MDGQNNLPRRSETVLFVGAGATACLGCPTSGQQGNFIFQLCDKVWLTPRDISDSSLKCFHGKEQDVCNILNLLDYAEGNRSTISDEQESLLGRCFPDVERCVAEQRIRALRDVFDWHALKLVAKSKKGSTTTSDQHDLFIQEVFTLMDACLREERGYNVYVGEHEVFLTPDRIQAARRMLIHIINTMFACAYQQISKDTQLKDEYKQYQEFAKTLSRMMQTEGEHLTDQPLNLRDFYLFSYSIITTNFEPLFLWLFFQAHKIVNDHCPRVGGRDLKLFYDFPNTLGMYHIEDPGTENLSPAIWYPMTEAAVQFGNGKDGRHESDRLIRIGKYYFVHGSSNFRHCPKCGRLNLYLGDSWNNDSDSLFPAGLSEPFRWENKPRTAQERDAISRGEYDAKQCLFCGQLTHAQDNFEFMQTQLKSAAPSFIKEITDEALAALAGARHIVLLGYSLPLDDAIWGSLLTAMIQRRKTDNDRPVYCSVVCGCGGLDKWLCGDDLDAYIRQNENEREGKKAVSGIFAIKNARAVFGANNVRAYTGGIPGVFHNGNEADVRELLYPCRDCPTTWDTSAWLRNGVVVRGRDDHTARNWRKVCP